MKQIELISYGGGVPSLALIILNIHGKIKTLTGRKLDEIIFADTGWELRKTIDQLEIHKEYVKKHGFKIRTVKSKFGKLNDWVINKNNERNGRRFVDIPYFTKNEKTGDQVIQRRQCTHQFKIKPIHDFIRNKYGRVSRITQLGIHAKEIQRVKDSKFKKDINRYPLVDLNLDRSDCLKIVKNENLPLLPKSGCCGCPYKTTSILKRMATNTTNDDFDRAIEVDESLRNRKDGVNDGFLWSEMKPLKILRENPQLNFFDVDNDDGCDSGYCFV